MDPIESITPCKDTTFALMLAAQDLGHELVYLPKHGLAIDQGVACGQMQRAQLVDQDHDLSRVRATQP
jgi:Glutathione synthase/Ribosomal protein S6 modification enzyme (glutaminyl transferase)